MSTALFRIYYQDSSILGSEGQHAPKSVTVDTTSKLQKIDGFGFSQAFRHAKEFQNAPTALQKGALDLLFSPIKGAGFSIIRNHIGSGSKGGSILPTSPGSPADTYQQAYADFLVQYIKYYQQAGLNITHLGFLNEPNFSPKYSQIQISFNAQEAISFIPTLSKAVQSAGLKTAVTCYDTIG
ncbi:cellulosome enzyme [Colletotrichum cuscutae]|uniref:Cellulosome enzyme n=1 Tax=Colletotrichum cuscutae TaxID=1209917 RepID=A0AAI9Y4E2_9PEZI|nr:cellulosome enzyme [Colletotrichum cuscutae]